MNGWSLALQITQLLALGVIAYFLRSYLPSYFTEKGKNLATKEDVAEITDKIEAVRSQYAIRSHAGSLSIEREYNILSEVWATLVEVRAATASLRPLLDTYDPNEPLDERKKQRLEHWYEAFSRFADVVEKNRPFYPQKIYEALREIGFTSRDEADEYRVRNPERRPLDEKYWRSAIENNRKIVEQVDNVCELIRQRTVG